MSITNSDSLRNLLCSSLDKRYCVLVSRATSGIYIALKTLDKINGKVICPTLMCPNPANAIHYAGFEPLFCDSNLYNFNVDIEGLKTLIEANSDIVAIIAPHMYGQPCQIDIVKQLAAQYDILLIEDLAQAYGASLNNVPLGFYGDFAVVSFGHTKIVDIGMGGALLTNNYELYKLAKLIQKSLPQKPLNYSDIVTSYRKEYYQIQNSNLGLQHQTRERKALINKYQNMYIYGLDADFSLEALNALSSLEENISIRRSNYNQFIDKLECNGVYIPPLNPGSAPWRFNFLSTRQKAITKKLRLKNLDASNWYPTIHRLFVDDALGCNFKNANRIEDEIVNLWINPGISKQYIDECCIEIKNIINSN